MPCMLGSRHSGHCKEERGMRMSPEPGARCLGTYLSPTRPRWPKLCRKQKWASDPAMEWGGGGGCLVMGLSVPFVLWKTALLGSSQHIPKRCLNHSQFQRA